MNDSINSWYPFCVIRIHAETYIKCGTYKHHNCIPKKKRTVGKMLTKITRGFSLLPTASVKVTLSPPMLLIRTRKPSGQSKLSWLVSPVRMQRVREVPQSKTQGTLQHCPLLVVWLGLLYRWKSIANRYGNCCPPTYRTQHSKLNRR